MTGSLMKLGAVIAAVFTVKAIVDFGKESVKAATELTNALMGLQSITEGQGRSFKKAREFLDDYVSDGLIPATEAATAMKNLSMRGYSDEQIQNVLVALKDSAAFGRQASLTLGEAVSSATEGLKNENSILVDNAGVTKNVSVMWREYAQSIGVSVNALTKQQKIQAEVNGILHETRFQTGDAAKIAASYSGQVLSLGYNFNRLKVAVGNALIPIAQAVLPSINAIISGLATLANVFAQVTSLIFGKASGAGAATNTYDDVAVSAGGAAAAQDDLAKSTKAAGKAADGALASFDNLNVLQKKDSSGSGAASGGGAGGDGIEIPKGVADWGSFGDNLKISPQVKEFVDKLKGMFGELKKGFSGVDWGKIEKAFGGLWDALKPFGKTIGEGLAWFYKNVLAPFGTWVLNDAIPAILDVLSAFFKAMNPVVRAVGSALADFYNAFLKPIARWAGQTIVKLLGLLAKALVALGEWADKHQGAIKTAAKILLALLTAVLAYKAAKAIAPIIDTLRLMFMYFLDGLKKGGVAQGVSMALGSMGGSLAKFGTSIKAFLVSNWVTLLIGALVGVVSAIVQFAKDIEQAKVEEGLKKVFGNVEYSVDELKESIGSFASEGAVKLQEVSDKMKPPVDEMKVKFGEAKGSFEEMAGGFVSGANKITKEAMPSILEETTTTFSTWRESLDAEKKYQLAFWEEMYLQNDGVIDVGEQNILKTIADSYVKKEDKVTTLEGQITDVFRNHVNEQGTLTAEGIRKLSTVMEEMESVVRDQRERTIKESEERQRLFLNDLASGREKATQETYDNYIKAIEERETEALKLASDKRAEANVIAKEKYDEGAIDYSEYLSMLKTSDETYFKFADESYEKAAGARKEFTNAIGTYMATISEDALEAKKAYEDQLLASDELDQALRDLYNSTDSAAAATEEYRSKQAELEEKLAASRERATELGLAFDDLRDKQKHQLTPLLDVIKHIQDSQDTAHAAAKDMGINVMTGLDVGLKDKASAPIKSWEDCLNGISYSTRRIMDMHSPSGVTKEQGAYIAQGLALGITENTQAVVAAATGLASALINHFTLTLGIDKDGQSGIFRSYGEGLTEGMAGGVTNSTGLVVSAFKTMFNAIASNMQSFANNFLAGWRHMVQQAANMAGKLPNAPLISVPSYSPITIPKLATGAVIPPNAEFMAVLGDQKNGRNLEAPEGLLRQIVREEMAGMSGTSDVNVRLTTDMPAFTQLFKVEIQKEHRRVGRGLIKGGDYA